MQDRRVETSEVRTIQIFWRKPVSANGRNMQKLYKGHERGEFGKKPTRAKLR